jgi:hypothetical protein
MLVYVTCKRSRMSHDVVRGGAILVYVACERSRMSGKVAGLTYKCSRMSRRLLA